MASVSEFDRELQVAIEKALIERFGGRLLSIKIEREVDHDGDDVVRVELSVAINSARWTRGSMMDLVSVTASTLREHGEHAVPYVVAKRSEAFAGRAH